MSLPTSQSFPDDFNDLSPVQKRRIRQAPLQATQIERDSFFGELKRRTTPAFDYFLYILLGAAIMGFGILLDSPLILIVAAVATPFMTPLMGFTLAPALESLTLFFKSLASLLISLVIFFVGGTLAGFITRYLPQTTPTQLPNLISSNWITWIVLVIASVLVAIFMVRNEDNPRMAGVLLNYLIMLPMAVAGFYLSIGNTSWLQTLILSVTHLGLSAMVAAIIFFFLGLPPRHASGWLLFLILLAISITLIVVNFSNRLQLTPDLSPTLPTHVSIKTPLSTSTATATVATLLPTDTATNPPTQTPTSTPTSTSTLTPTPAWAQIRVDQGAVIRAEPSFEAPIVTSAQDGSLVRLLGETYQSGTSVWVKVVAEDGIEGWILRSLLITAIPSS